MDPIAIIISVGASLVTAGTAYGLLVGRSDALSKRIDDKVKAREALEARVAIIEAHTAILGGDCKVLTQRVDTLDVQHDRLSGDLRAMEARILDGVKQMVDSLRRELEASGAIVRPDRR